MLVSLTLYSSDIRAQIGLGFNKNAPVWWPLKSADYNAGFKYAYLDIEAFVNSVAVHGIHFGQDSEGKTVIISTILVDDYSLHFVDEMIEYYREQALNPDYGNVDYRKGMEGAAEIWSSIRLWNIVGD